MVSNSPAMRCWDDASVFIHLVFSSQKMVMTESPLLDLASSLASSYEGSERNYDRSTVPKSSPLVEKARLQIILGLGTVAVNK